MPQVCIGKCFNRSIISALTNLPSQVCYAIKRSNGMVYCRVYICAIHICGRELFSSPHTKPSRIEEVQHFFATEVQKSEEANPSRDGKVQLTTSLSAIYRSKYLKYCEDVGIKQPLRINKFYEIRKQSCPDIHKSREFKKSKIVSIVASSSLI